MIIYSKEQLNAITMATIQEAYRDIHSLCNVVDDRYIKIAFNEWLDMYLFEVHDMIMKNSLFGEMKWIFNSWKDEITVNMLVNGMDTAIHSTCINFLENTEISLKDIINETIENTKRVGIIYTENWPAYSGHAISKYGLISVFFYEWEAPLIYI